MTTYSLLWDIRKFFDSMYLPTLIKEAHETNFPLDRLTLSLIVHAAPRRLRFRGSI